MGELDGCPHLNDVGPSSGKARPMTALAHFFNIFGTQSSRARPKLCDIIRKHAGTALLFGLERCVARGLVRNAEPLRGIPPTTLGRTICGTISRRRTLEKNDSLVTSGAGHGAATPRVGGRNGAGRQLGELGRD